MFTKHEDVHSFWEPLIPLMLQYYWTQTRFVFVCRTLSDQEAGSLICDYYKVSVQGVCAAISMSTTVHNLYFYVVISNYYN